MNCIQLNISLNDLLFYLFQFNLIKSNIYSINVKIYLVKIKLFFIIFLFQNLKLIFKHVREEIQNVLFIFNYN